MRDGEFAHSRIVMNKFGAHFTSIRHARLSEQYDGDAGHWSRVSVTLLLAFAVFVTVAAQVAYEFQLLHRKRNALQCQTDKPVVGGFVITEVFFILQKRSALRQLL